MAKYRTAMGRTLDMSTLAAKHEKTRAVGNMSVNARGDTIDADGKVVVPVTKKVGEKYQKTVMNRAANIVKGNRQPVEKRPEPKPAPQPVQEELTPEELELEASFEDDLAVEEIKAQELQEQGYTIKPASEAPDFYKPE